MGVSNPPPDADAALELLAIGDVHLGTRPSRLGGVLAAAGIPLARLTPESALAAAVDLAIDRRVDAVLFAGDVVESTNARFEALRPLEEAVRRLVAAGIPALGVVGNHDVEALPRLARRIAGFELLGEGGRWTRRALRPRGAPDAAPHTPGAAGSDRPEAPTLEIVGWSFPEPRVSTSPLASLARDLPASPTAPGAPTSPHRLHPSEGPDRPSRPSRPAGGPARIGLLHGDLDARGGSYAPFSAREVQQSGLDALLLGHIHKPSLADGPVAPGVTACGYLGSLVGLDPNETGPHGPWLVRVSATGRMAFEHVPLAPLRWEHVDVRLGEDETPDDAGDRLLDEMERAVEHIARESGESIGSREAGSRLPEVLGLRVRLVGPVRRYAALRRWIADLADPSVEPIARTVGETFVFVDHVRDGLEPAVDLAAIAKGTDPASLLARKLLALARPGEERDRLIAAARERLEPIARDATWSPVAEMRDARDPLGDEALVALLEQSGRTALQVLLDQRRGPATPAGGEPA